MNRESAIARLRTLLALKGECMHFMAWYIKFSVRVCTQENLNRTYFFYARLVGFIRILAVHIIVFIFEISSQEKS